MFIHGLQGHPIHTWKYNGAQDDTEPKQNKFKNFLRSMKGKSKHGESSADFESNILNNSDDINGARQTVFWPYDLLPKICCDARILVWGYDTQITKGYRESTNKSNIFAQGKSFYNALRRERPQDRPLIFVAHSLGGIVTKQVRHNCTFS